MTILCHFKPQQCKCTSRASHKLPPETSYIVIPDTVRRLQPISSPKASLGPSLSRSGILSVFIGSRAQYTPSIPRWWRSLWRKVLEHPFNATYVDRWTSGSSVIREIRNLSNGNVLGNVQMCNGPGECVYPWGTTTRIDVSASGRFSSFSPDPIEEELPAAPRYPVSVLGGSLRSPCCLLLASPGAFQSKAEPVASMVRISSKHTISVCSPYTNLGTTSDLRNYESTVSAWERIK